MSPRQRNSLVSAVSQGAVVPASAGGSDLVGAFPNGGELPFGCPPPPVCGAAAAGAAPPGAAAGVTGTTGKL
jgi:hypothetical protein